MQSVLNHSTAHLCSNTGGKKEWIHLNFPIYYQGYEVCKYTISLLIVVHYCYSTEINM